MRDREVEGKREYKSENERIVMRWNHIYLSRKGSQESDVSLLRGLLGCSLMEDKTKIVSK